MKLISFTVPCFNSESYMCKCIDSILSIGERAEIIIVNDGSKDGTLKIANDYKAKYPDIVKVIDKPNGGHGSGVNAGMKTATGLYFKVVDSDDWLDTTALKTLVEKIEEHLKSGELPDLYITNFVYDKPSENRQHVSRYTEKMPENEFFSWDSVKKFKGSHLMLMHALLYKREKLLESDTILPEHTFYVDNIFAFRPLPKMQKLFYLDIDLYHYFIGRADQSVNIANFSKRFDQQIRVMREIIDSYYLSEIKSMPTGLKKYMWHSINAIMMNTIFFACVADSKARRVALKELWRHIKERDIKLFRKLRYRSYSTSVNFLPWKLRGKIMKFGYDILCKKVLLG